MKKLLILALLFTACTKEIAPPSSPVSVPSVVPAPVIVHPPKPQLATITEVLNLAEKSSCASYKWKDRGLAPLSYIQGMALSYAREVCFPSKAVNAPLGDSSKDVLAWYNLPASALNVYAIMIGSGMRESSGKYCEGRDMSARNTTASSAEAGMFQTSYNAHVASPELDVIFNDFKLNSHNCLNIFKADVKCSDMTNYGSGDGLKFQQMAKDCPAFAVSFAAVTFRTLKNHYGPLIKKAAEYRPECVDMLNSVQSIVKSHPEFCDQLK